MNSRAEAFIASRRIAENEPPYIVAELSANHGGSIDQALRLIAAAAESGADAIKLQTYTADTITLDHKGPEFIIPHGPWKGRTLHALYQEAHTPWDWHERLFAEARNCGLTIFSSPFDPTAVNLLESLGAPAYKIASFEIVDLPLIEKCAQTGKPLIISTGMASLGEIEAAVTTARSAGTTDLVLLHCISAYPTPAYEMDLRTIAHLGTAFGAVPGLSDHSLGTAVAVASVALGARLIEKHFTLDRADGGPDADFSIEPHELKRLVADCRTAWEALGSVSYDPRGSERGNVAFRRSLYAVADIAAGERLSTDKVRSIRPGHGLSPRELPRVLTGRARTSITRGTPLSFDLIDFG